MPVDALAKHDFCYSVERSIVPICTSAACISAADRSIKKAIALNTNSLKHHTPATAVGKWA
jgi:hypothetical protein